MNNTYTDTILFHRLRHLLRGMAAMALVITTAIPLSSAASITTTASTPDSTPQPTGTPATTDADQPDETPVVQDDAALASAICDAVLAVEHFSGVVLVARGDHVLATRTAGQASRERGTDTSLNTLYDLASVSKPMTAVAIMRLVEQGLIDLDATLSHVLRTIPEAASVLEPAGATLDDNNWINDEDTPLGDDADEPAGVSLAHTTVRDLLRHRSGLAQNFPGGPPDMTTDRRAMLHCVAEFSTYAGTIEGDELGVGGGRPGRFQYNNTNYCVLAAVIEELAKRSFEADMRASVFVPASMQDVWFVGERRVPRDRGCDRYTSPRGMRGARFVADHPQGWLHRGATGVIASAPDVFHFARAVRTGKLLTQESTQEMFHISDGRTYALGWVVEHPAPGARVVHHVGQTRGCETLLAVIAPVWDEPSQDLTIVILTNMQGTIVPAWTDVRQRIAASLGWQPHSGIDHD